ncbi:conserved exported hypothetical protein [Hyella patelloides LEGE 07179]|uniref:Uncharacterized protein n=1 Tax=Hyella patelloides LEGE 07179 TaxID=945734 RepID=A0A563VMJ1_9CYAN|nr:hypothetical protein [Hyella patelloides]VEP12632.1 conserved exported hypothetical protein [Hyella patelloides LEGE 07179]
MLAEIWQEITELTKDRKFIRNLSLVAVIALASSFSLAASNHSERLAQQGKLDRCSNFMSMGLCIKTQNIVTK